MKYKIIVDNGKPYEKIADSDEELKTQIDILREESKKDNPYFDVTILNENNEDISETQYIQEMIKEDWFKWVIL